jgi:protein-disulfide isomerase
MKRLFIIAIMIYAGYSFYHREHAPVVVDDSADLSSRNYPQPPEDPNVVMYSLTTCGLCKQKAKELAELNIAHVEYFIDEDKERDDELTRSINAAKLPNRAYGTPIFSIYGEVLPDNPSIEVIKATIAKYRH